MCTASADSCAKMCSWFSENDDFCVLKIVGHDGRTRDRAKTATLYEAGAAPEWVDEVHSFQISAADMALHVAVFDEDSSGQILHDRTRPVFCSGFGS